MPWHPEERAALVDALRQAGPGAPTLCEGWTTEDLAAHVVLRESDAVVALGVAGGPLADRTERAIQRLGSRSADTVGYARLLGRLARGGPRWHPLRWTGDAGNLLELFVHTEDVRRGGADGATVAPRTRSAAHAAALWRELSRMARLQLRRSPVPVVLTDGAREVRGGPRHADVPSTRVTVRGGLDELVLHLFGRTDLAHVELEGPPDAVAAYRRFSGQAPRPGAATP